MISQNLPCAYETILFYVAQRCKIDAFFRQNITMNHPKFPESERSEICVKEILGNCIEQCVTRIQHFNGVYVSENQEKLTHIMTKGNEGKDSLQNMEMRHDNNHFNPSKDILFFSVLFLLLLWASIKAFKLLKPESQANQNKTSQNTPVRYKFYEDTETRELHAYPM